MQNLLSNISTTEPKFKQYKTLMQSAEAHEKSEIVDCQDLQEIARIFTNISNNITRSFALSRRIKNSLKSPIRIDDVDSSLTEVIVTEKNHIIFPKGRAELGNDTWYFYNGESVIKTKYHSYLVDFIGEYFQENKNIGNLYTGVIESEAGNRIIRCSGNELFITKNKTIVSKDEHYILMSHNNKIIINNITDSKTIYEINDNGNIQHEDILLRYPYLIYVELEILGYIKCDIDFENPCLAYAEIIEKCKNVIGWLKVNVIDLKTGEHSTIFKVQTSTDCITSLDDIKEQIQICQKVLDGNLFFCLSHWDHENEGTLYQYNLYLSRHIDEYPLKKGQVTFDMNENIIATCSDFIIEIHKIDDSQ